MLKFWIWLATRKGMNAHSAGRLLRHFSTPEQVYYAPPERFEKINGLRGSRSLADKSLEGAENILAQCRKAGIGIMTLHDAAYPSRLRALEDAPIVLYYKGTLADLDAPSVAIVGTREATDYGLEQAKHFGCGLAQCGCTVLSGGARGVDTQALRGALLGGGTAIAVLGCGLDMVYPRENKGLFCEIMERGCLLSEYPPGTIPYASNFPARNRILSGMSLGVLVTQAPAKSGALITAHHALDQGRDVFVLPANVGDDSCRGNLALLREGAIPVEGPWDIIEEYEAQYPQVLEKRTYHAPEEKVQETACDKKVIDKPKSKAYIDVKDVTQPLTPEQQRLVQALRGGELFIDDLVEKAAMTAAEALPLLTVLEVMGIVRRPCAGTYELAEK